MINCDRRQREVRRARDGTETEQHRCVEKKADTYLKIVDIPTCEACPYVRHWSEELISVTVTARDIGPNVDTERDLGYASPCPHRWDGVCQVTGKEINPEICLACDQETATEMASLPKKVANYAGAIRRWIREGRPVRTDEEVTRILKICQGDPESPDPEKRKPCKLYDAKSHACLKCGCVVSTDKAPLKSKIRMRSEICPLGLWK